MEAPPNFFSSARLLFIKYTLLVEKAHPASSSQPGLVTAAVEDDLSVVEHAAFLSSLPVLETAVDSHAALATLADHGKVICRFVIAGSIARKL